MSLNSPAKANFHTHSTFCDGNNSPEEMILSAIEKGFDVLGFSGHSIYPFASTWHIAPNRHNDYVKEIRSLAEKYKEQIKIFSGFEVDFLPPLCTSFKNQFAEFKPDYLIGSVHYIMNEKGWFTVDNTPEELSDGIKNCFNGNVKAAVCTYFELQRAMLKAGGFEIWGHPDLIRKRNGILRLFDENESWYKEELQLTAKAAAKAGVIAEINTGAIARGAMDDTYPSEYFLTLIYEAGVPVCINSDAHDTKNLDCAFDRAAERAKKIGYKGLNYPCGIVIKF